MDPVNYPTVTFDGKEYPVKFRLSDVVRMQHEGVDLFNKGAYIDREQAMWRYSHMIAAGIRHIAPDVTWEDVANKMPWPEIVASAVKVNEALGKVLAQAMGSEAAKSPQIQ